MSATYKCQLCGKTKIPAEQTFDKETNLVVPATAVYHKVASSIGGGGKRDCGPCEKE